MPKLSEDAKIIRYFKKRLKEGHTFSILIGQNHKDSGFKSGTYLYAKLTEVKGKIEIEPTGTSFPPGNPFARTTHD